MVSEEKLDVYCCARGVPCCCCFLQQRGAGWGVRHNFRNYTQNKITILCQSEYPKSRHIPNTPTSKTHFWYNMETPYMDRRAGSTRKLICLTYPVSSPQRSGALLRRDRRSQNTCLEAPLPYVCRSALSREQWRLALSKVEKLLR